MKGRAGGKGDDDERAGGGGLGHRGDKILYLRPGSRPSRRKGERPLSPVTLAYETYGSLNADKSNAVLVLHALTGDAHAAGLHEGDKDPGWWDNMIGPGKAFDTDRYFIICSNVLGGCRGSTGPSSINPATGKPYGLDFPLITVGDMVNAQRHLVDYLGIDRLLSVAGGSMGGMQALQWVVSYPERVRSVIPIATTATHSPQQIAFNEVGRQAIMADPNWNEGDYYGRELPAKGLSVARMIGHITYMSDLSMSEKFGRRFRNGHSRFLLRPRISRWRAISSTGGRISSSASIPTPTSTSRRPSTTSTWRTARGLQEVLRGVKARFLVIAFKSDWLYPAYQSQEIARACKRAGVEAIYAELNSTWGHDAFLIEVEEQAHLIKHFLKRCIRHGT